MSLSKQLVKTTAEEPRQPKCSRCRNHGIIVPQKGHMRVCPFIDCSCWKCCLFSQRSRLTALQRSLNTTQDKEQRSGAREVKPAGGRASSPEEGAPPPAKCGRIDSAAASTWCPQDVPSKPAVGLDRREVPEEPPQRSSVREVTPLPVIHFPLRVPFYIDGCATCQKILLSMPVPAQMYNDGFLRPGTFPDFQPEPPAQCRPVFHLPVSPPELIQEEVTSRELPRPEHTETDPHSTN